MTRSTPSTDRHARIQALAHPRPSVRLQAALATGTAGDPADAEVLIERCATEPDFFVRDMLTWALTRLPSDAVVAQLVMELDSPVAQARSQALHTLSKLHDDRAWPAVTNALLADPDPEVARAAWRVAVALVPRGQEDALAAVLASQLGRGDAEVQLSLSRALVALGDAAVPALRAATAHDDPRVRRHAEGTERLRHDPVAGLELAVDVATRAALLGRDAAGDDPC